jgi:hypothetical protein
MNRVRLVRYIPQRRTRERDFPGPAIEPNSRRRTTFWRRYPYHGREHSTCNFSAKECSAFCPDASMERFGPARGPIVARPAISEVPAASVSSSCRRVAILSAPSGIWSDGTHSRYLASVGRRGRENKPHLSQRTGEISGASFRSDECYSLAARSSMVFIRNTKLSVALPRSQFGLFATNSCHRDTKTVASAV